MKNFRLKFSLTALLFVLLINPQIINPVNAVEDTTPPTLSYLGFNKPVVNAGDKVTVLVGANDDLSGLSHIEVGFADPMGTWKAQPFPTYNSSSGFYEADILIDQFWLSGTYYIAFVYTVDNAGNSAYLYNATDFTSPTVDVIGTTPDSTAPTLNSISFNSGTASPTSPITVSVNVNDSESGVSHIEIGIADPTGTWKTQPFPLYNSTSGYWDATVTIDQYWLGGDYYVAFVYTVDNAGNYIYRYNETDFISPTFNVIGTTPDIDPPSLWSISLSQTTTSSTNPFQVSLNITDDISGISHVEVGIADPTGTWKAQPFPTYNSTNGLWEATVDIDPFWLLGTYYVAFVYTVDNAGNYIYRYNSTDFVSPTINVIAPTPDIYPPNAYANLTNFNTYGGAFNVEVVSNETGWGEVYINGTFYKSLTFSSPTTFWLDTHQFINGYYNLTLFVSDYSGNSITITYWIYIQNDGPPVNQEIKLSVIPNKGESIVNKTVSFEIEIHTSFIHDMPNVTLVVQSEDSTNPVNYYTNSFFLAKQSSVTFTVPITFIQEGNYKFEAILYDDIQAPWFFNFEWNVVGPNGTDTNTDITSNTDTTQTNSTEASSSSAPGLPVPGFSTLVSLFTLSALLILRIKKKDLSI
ncbi:MAG: hypothetical protein GPJ54_11310 [Candidatus Heimdallarchaeota archaeon]|nr:hypothetical protein [Candidatus Heimdallarchaeota archaeon]